MPSFRLINRSDDKWQRTNDRCQMTDDRGQRTENRRNSIVISYWLLAIGLRGWEGKKERKSEV